MDKDLSQQLSHWSVSREYQKIIDAIQAIEGYQEDPELATECARSYMNLSLRAEDAWQKLDYARLAVNVLQACHARLPPPAKERPLVGLDPWREWHYQLGIAYEMQDLFHRAMRHFQALAKIDPTYRGDAETRYRQNRDRVSSQWLDLSFDRRVQDVWQFLSQTQTLSTFMALFRAEEPDKQQEGIDVLKRILRLVMPDMPPIKLRAKEERLQITLPLEGSYARALRYAQLLSAQPKESVYDFQVGFPAVETLPTEFANQRMRCRVIEQKPLRVELLFAQEDWQSYPERDRQQIARRAVDAALGELAALRYVEEVTFLSTWPTEEPMHTLADLRGLVEAAGGSLSLTVDDLLQTVYTGEEEPVEEDFLRSDVYRYQTNFLALVNEWKYLENDTFSELGDASACALMFILPPAKTEAAAQELVNTFQSAFIDALGERASRVLHFVGSAYGKKHTYVDAVAWHLKDCLKAASQAKKALSGNVQYQLFDFRYPVADLDED